jgi:hypothetical protein
MESNAAASATGAAGVARAAASGQASSTSFTFDSLDGTVASTKGYSVEVTHDYRDQYVVWTTKGPQSVGIRYGTWDEKVLDDAQHQTLSQILLDEDIRIWGNDTKISAGMTIELSGQLGAEVKALDVPGLAVTMNASGSATLTVTGEVSGSLNLKHYLIGARYNSARGYTRFVRNLEKALRNIKGVPSGACINIVYAPVLYDQSVCR